MTPKARAGRLVAMPTAALWTAGLGISVLLMIINANDYDKDPPTDLADGVATLAALSGAAVWFAPRWIDTDRPAVRIVRGIAAGVAIGSVVTGLASVVYDPWAN